MRTLKFRAFHDGKWHHFTLAGLSVSEEGEYYWLDNPDVPICEFTGLTDRHGVEIYEGDILKPKWVIKWSDKQVGFVIVDDSIGFENLELSPGGMTGEVIGNIYENPELVR